MSEEEKKEEVYDSVLESNNKILEEFLIKNLDIDETIKDRYEVNLKRIVNKINPLSATEKVSKRVLTKFGEKNLVIETEKRLIIFSLGKLNEIIEVASVGFNHIKRLDFDTKHKKISIRRKNVVQIHDHFQKKLLEIPKNLDISIRTENWEHLFHDLENLNCEKTLH